MALEMAFYSCKSCCSVRENRTEQHTNDCAAHTLRTEAIASARERLAEARRVRASGQPGAWHALELAGAAFYRRSAQAGGAVVGEWSC